MNLLSKMQIGDKNKSQAQTRLGFIQKFQTERKNKKKKDPHAYHTPNLTKGGLR